MRYWISTVFLIILSINLSQAQIEPVLRSRPEHDLRMLIVPFDPRIYYNDASPEMEKIYDKSHEELMNYFRVQWNRNMHMAFIDSCYTIDLLSDNTKEARDDIDGLYTCISYTMEDKMQNYPELEEEPNFFRSLFRSIFPKKEKKVEKIPWETRTEHGEIISNRQSSREKFAHIVFSNKNFLSDLAFRRNIDLFLFINYFEIRGDYSDPYASGQADLQRYFKVHFSIFDSYGDLVHGGYSHVEIPFYLYDREEIVNNYFPPAIRQIIYNIDFKY